MDDVVVDNHPTPPDSPRLRHKHVNFANNISDHTVGSEQGSEDGEEPDVDLRPTLEPARLEDNLSMLFLSSENKTLEQTGKLTPVRPFLGPTSPFYLDFYIDKEEHCPVSFLDKRDVICISTDFYLLRSEYSVQLSSLETMYHFQVLVSIRLHKLFFQVLVPILMVNFFLFIIVFEEEVSYDLQAALLFTLVMGYNGIRPENVPNMQLDYIDLVSCSSFTACTIASVSDYLCYALVALNICFVGGCLLWAKFEKKRVLDTFPVHFFGSADEIKSPGQNLSARGRRNRNIGEALAVIGETEAHQPDDPAPVAAHVEDDRVLPNNG
mmetsp:Transcript_10232/g.15768  ORF Transcript_10232/g.15768 Transcript_10232/m.15768 type:complete len:324 (+) Transcript_10232:62-1033(+)